MKITALVVTYNRIELLRQCLDKLLSQTRMPDEILVVDNASTDGTQKMMEELVREHASEALDGQAVLKYVRLQTNTGGSGGFAYGLREAYEEGADFIWGMDDDAMPHVDALEELVKNYDAARDAAGGHPPALWSNCRSGEASGESAVTQVNNWTFVGFYLAKEMLQRVGFPRDDFFIYWDDVEYAARIQRKGFKIFRVNTSKIDHKENTLNYYPAKKFLGIVPLTWLKMDDWRLYYFTRNRLLMYRWDNPAKWFVEFFEIPLNRLKVSFFKTGQEAVFKKAVHDARQNRTGKTVEPGQPVELN